jgi:hypothetical protein
MEPLWSPAVATSRNRWQMGGRRERLRQAKTVAVGCDQLPELFHGKEGVDGSSPSEGLRKVPVNRHFVVVFFLNARTHSGHICGTRVAPRRLATSIDTNLITKSLLEPGNSPANGKLQLSETKRERDPFSAGRGSAPTRSRRFPAHRRQLRSEWVWGNPWQWTRRVRLR